MLELISLKRYRSVKSKNLGTVGINNLESPFRYKIIMYMSLEEFMG